MTPFEEIEAALEQAKEDYDNSVDLIETALATLREYKEKVDLTESQLMDFFNLYCGTDEANELQVFNEAQAHLEFFGGKE